MGGNGLGHHGERVWSQQVVVIEQYNPLAGRERQCVVRGGRDTTVRLSW